MELSNQQEGAFKKVSRWKRLADKPFFVLGGVAGSGKTTIAKALIGDTPNAIVAAYTGKAAHVLRQHGLPASTIHKLIYLPRDKCDAKLQLLLLEKKKLLEKPPIPHDKLVKLEKKIDRERKNLKRLDFTLNGDSPLAEASLLVIDEYSMIDEQMATDLLSFGCPILALGDPAQLPPVHGRSFFRDPPDVMLTEIHRQAEGNPIIALSKIVREGGRLKIGQYGDSRVVRMSSLNDTDYNGLVMSCNQVLVGLNRTRHNFNQEFRSQLRRTSNYPQNEDKLICLRNNHKENLLNGQTWIVEHASPSGSFLSLTLRNIDDGDRISCLAHTNPFRNPSTEIEHSSRKNANEFDFGYAMTVHKSQGSQWDSIVLIDEWRLKDRAKWLYTGITRASKKLTIVVP